MTGELFTEKYRPQSLDDIGGYNKNIDEIINWGNRFYDEVPTSKKGLILHGSAGIGKTSIAFAMAKDYGWEVIEVNASDSRTYSDLIEKLMPHAQSQQINNNNGRQLILIEEVDNLYSASGKRDLTGEKAILEILTLSKNPIILTCNDVFKVPFSIKNICEQIKFNKPKIPSITKILKNIVQQEKDNIPEDVYNRLLMSKKIFNSMIKKGKIDKSTKYEDFIQNPYYSKIYDELVVSGDVRSSINNLQIFLISGIIPDGKKGKNYSSFELVDKIFTTNDPFELEDLIHNSDLNPQDAIFWIEENVKYRYKGLERVYAYKALQKADIYLKKATETGDYNLYWKLAVKEMTTNVALARRYPTSGGWTKTEYPVYFKKLSNTKTVRKTMNSIIKKMLKNNLIHTSKSSFIVNEFPLIRRKCMESDLEFLIKITIICKFDENEIAMLLDSDVFDPRIKKVLKAKPEISYEMAERIERHDQRCQSLNNFF